MPNDKSLQNFFTYYVIGFAFCLFKVDLDKSYRDIIVGLFLTFIYCNIVGIWTGLFGMFGQDLYFYIKRKLKKK